MKRTLIFYIHSLAGLFSGLFILLMSLSGAALVFHEDINALQKPMVGPGKTPSPILSVDSCYQVVQNNYPGASISNCVIANNDRQPFSFTIYDSSYEDGRKSLQLFIHPVTGQILQSRGASDDFMSWLSKFHNSFHLGKTGEWLLGFFALVFLTSLVTGSVLFRKSLLPVLFFKKEVFRKNNLHQLVGVYALFFNLMIAVTGFWMQRYVFKKDFYTSYDYTPVLKASPPLSFSFDSAYATLQKKQSGFRAYVIYFAQGKKGKTAVYGSRSFNAFIHSKKFADAVFLDSSGAVAATRFVNEISAADQYDIINSQLHMGRYGGFTVKIIYFLFGLAGSFLSITGFLLWLKRKKPAIND